MIKKVGRPSLGDDARIVITATKIRKPDSDKLAALAKRLGKTKSTIVFEAIIEKLERDGE